MTSARDILPRLSPMPERLSIHQISMPQHTDLKEVGILENLVSAAVIVETKILFSR